MLITLYVAGVSVLSRTLEPTGINRGARLLTGTGALLFLPVFFSLMNGQDTAFLLLGVAIWGYGLLTGKEIIAGFGLSLATVRPHIALLLAIPMLFRYRKGFVGFLIGSGLLAALSLLVLGPNGTRDFINIIFLSVGGEWYGMKEDAMYNLIGLLTRSLPQLEAGTVRALGWGAYALALVSLCIVWPKTKDPGTAPIGLSVTLALFAVPHLHFHDLALLLIPVYEFIRLSRETGNPKTSVVIMLPIAFSLLLLLSNITPFLQYTIPYLILLALAVYLYKSRLRMTVTAPHRP